MFIKYKHEIVNINLTFDMKTNNYGDIIFVGPAQYRETSFRFKNEKQAIDILEQIYNFLKQDRDCLDIEKDILGNE